ncbi:MAG: hypothetical protein AAGA60_04000 [Cyanobacteria bacterium P01_E01_bin.42]
MKFCANHTFPTHSPSRTQKASRFDESVEFNASNMELDTFQTLLEIFVLILTLSSQSPLLGFGTTLALLLYLLLRIRSDR